MSSQQRLRRDHDAGTKRLLAEDQPQRNVCVRIDMLTIPTTPLCNQFYLQTEQWIYCDYTGSYAGPAGVVKGLGIYGGLPVDEYHDAEKAPFRPGVNAGQSGDVFGNAVATLNSHDPNGVFSNTFPDTLLS